MILLIVIKKNTFLMFRDMEVSCQGLVLSYHLRPVTGKSSQVWSFPMSGNAGGVSADDTSKF